MVKHWHLSHKDVGGDPQFRIRMVKSFGDALSRQISESVRIDLRGDNVLNSRTEYSRCRVPRLTIDKEEWKTAKKSERKLLEAKESVVSMEDEGRAQRRMEEDMTTWQEKIIREKSKRKPLESKERPAKRKNLDRLVEWGVRTADEKRCKLRNGCQRLADGS